MIDLFSGANISASGMSAERLRMETVANNIANANTTRTENGDPFRRKQLIFGEQLDAAQSAGVVVLGTEDDQSDFPTVYMPEHPHADENGILRLSNVKLPNEMIDLITASRAYEANLKALTSFKEMVEQTLTLLRIQQ